VTKILRKDKLFYSKYCSSSTLIKNGQFVIKLTTSFVKFDFIGLLYILSRYNNGPSTTSDECNAAVNLKTAAIDIDVIASYYTS